MTHKTRDADVTPRWVKVFAVVALVVVLLFVVLMLTGRGGGHGPGRHTPSGDAGTPPAGVRGGQIPPIGADAQR